MRAIAGFGVRLAAAGTHAGLHEQEGRGHGSNSDGERRCQRWVGNPIDAHDGEQDGH
jgi:hypothetical protein